MIRCDSPSSAERKAAMVDALRSMRLDGARMAELTRMSRMQPAALMAAFRQPKAVVRVR